MNGATTAPDDVGRYVGAVRDALADLPADERDDLLLEVEASIADAAGDSDAPVAARLGPPEEFAAELREAAGFHVASTAQRAEHGGLRSLARRVARHPAWRRILSLARDLGILAVWLGTGWAERYPFVPRFNGSAALGVALVAVGVAASVAVGLFMRRREIRSRLAVVANLALVVALWAVLVEVDNATWGSPQAVAFVETPTDGLALDGVPITNIYPYGRNGQRPPLRPGRRAARGAGRSRPRSQPTVRAGQERHDAPERLPDPLLPARDAHGGASRRRARSERARRGDGASCPP